MTENKKHPYLVSQGNLTTTFAKFRSSLPPTINVKTLQRLSLAKSNEKSVIDILEFVGLIEDEKATEAGKDIFHTADDAAFGEKLAKQLERAYESLFQDHGASAWELEDKSLIGYFRSADKTSETTGKRQYYAFSTLASLAGKRAAQPITAPRSTTATPRNTNKTKPKTEEKSSSLNLSEQVGRRAKIDSNLNVNIQVHIAADTPPAVIATIFENMGKYLLGNE